MFEYLLVIIPYWIAFEAGACARKCFEDTEDKKIEKIVEKVIMNVRPICSYYRDINTYR
jgi:hypothetical protein